MIALPQAAPAIAAPHAAIAPINPLLDRRYRLTTETVRDDGAVRRRFVQTTDLVFRRDGDAFAVDMTLVDLHADPDDATAARFRAGAGALKDVTVHLHLDAGGRVLAIDDEAAVWAKLLAGFAAMADHRADQPLALAHDPASFLRALPPPARLAMIAGAVRAAVPTHLEPGTRPVSLPSLSAGGAPLPGTETVSAADATLRDETHAYREAPEGAQSIDRIRRIDVATGLLIDAVETATTRIGTRIATSTRTDRLLPVP